ncbi:hypothetical protein EK21DRAFT_107428 [Setomelanomma holmii]|uniref:Heterokaryon incompatibility domain-containing protein n=1 Tax=Setomelanomma holmii TaxID=210430 RepID=A0A9P4HJ26_9PLEO|nr:hypothetical protein EK21DRAFT_107428 [Setomelanomma holmii]
MAIADDEHGPPRGYSLRELFAGFGSTDEGTEWDLGARVVYESLWGCPSRSPARQHRSTKPLASSNQFLPAATSPLREIKQDHELAQARGRRSTSPEPFEDNAWGRSQSPAASFYSDDGREGIIGAARNRSRSWTWSQSRSLAHSQSSSPHLHDVSSLYDASPATIARLVAAEVVKFQQPSARGSASNLNCNLPAYTYLPLSSSEVRLLRISPGDYLDPLVCALKPVSVTRVKSAVLSFQALSYAWEKGNAEHVIILSDLAKPEKETENNKQSAGSVNETIHYSFLVKDNLCKALRRMRQSEVYVWLWVDAVCINQEDETDKTQQIPSMPDIYSSPWNVVV